MGKVQFLGVQRLVLQKEYLSREFAKFAEIQVPRKDPFQQGPEFLESELGPLFFRRSAGPSVQRGESPNDIENEQSLQSLTTNTHPTKRDLPNWKFTPKWLTQSLFLRRFIDNDKGFGA